MINKTLTNTACIKSHARETVNSSFSEGTAHFDSLFSLRRNWLTSCNPSIRNFKLESQWLTEWKIEDSFFCFACSCVHQFGLRARFFLFTDPFTLFLFERKLSVFKGNVLWMYLFYSQQFLLPVLLSTRTLLAVNNRKPKEKSQLRSLIS